MPLQGQQQARRRRRFERLASAQRLDAALSVAASDIGLFGDTKGGLETSESTGGAGTLMAHANQLHQAELRLLARTEKDALFTDARVTVNQRMLPPSVWPLKL